MVKRFNALFLLCLVFMSIAIGSTASAQSSAVLNGTFVNMYAVTACPTPTSTTCYLTNPAQASSVVSALTQTGAKYFMMPAALSGGSWPSEFNQLQTLASAIDAQGGKFLVSERWDWQIGYNCDQFQSTINNVLLPLATEFPNSFYGLQFLDEPNQTELSSLGQLKACIKQQPALAGLKIFLNLVPLNANSDSLNGGPNPGALDPSDYGVDCSTNTITNSSLVTSMVNNYTSYVLAAINDVDPDYLSFDFYPITQQYDNCTAARELVMSENMSIVASQALRYGVTPITYLQNAELSPLSPDTGDTALEYANFNLLRWYSSWFFTFGGNGFANFVSHDTVDSNGNPQYEGILSSNNTPRPLASDEQSTYGMNQQVQNALAGYPFQDFVAPFLNVMSGSVIGWLPSDQVMAGEYGTPSSGTVMLFFASRPTTPNVSVTIGLNQWWTTIEQLNFATGTWQVVGNSTNAITVNPSNFPGALYRLSH
jgi:hypothetical protein